MAVEKDNEVKGQNNHYTTEFRQYDPRIGRWMSLDPLMDMFPDVSAYCAFDNNPIYYSDPYGLAPGDRKRERQRQAENQNSANEGNATDCYDNTYVSKDVILPTITVHVENHTKEDETNRDAAKEEQNLEEMHPNARYLVNHPPLQNPTSHSSNPFLPDFISPIANLDFVAELDVDVSVGLQIGVKGNIGTVKGTAEVNVVSADIVGVGGDFTDSESWDFDYIGEDHRIDVSNSFSLGVEIPVDIPSLGKPGIGLHGNNSFELDIRNGNGYNPQSDIGFSGSMPLGKKQSSKSIDNFAKNKIHENLKTPSISPKVKLKSNFFGIDVGLGGKFFLGIDVNLKLGVNY